MVKYPHCIASTPDWQCRVSSTCHRPSSSPWALHTFDNRSTTTFSLWKFSFFPKVRIVERTGGALRRARPCCAQGFPSSLYAVICAKSTNERLCVINIPQSRHQVTATIWPSEALDRRTCEIHSIGSHSMCPRRDVAIEGIATAFESALKYRNTNCCKTGSSNLANVVRALVCCSACTL